MIELRESELRQLCPRARQDYITALMQGVPLLQRYGILANRQRWCAFIANVAHETGGLTIIRENMNYTAANLLRVWPSRYPNTKAGRAKASDHAKRGPHFIANYNYGNRLGNLGRHTSDGWDFRGALLLQHTGRSMAEWLQGVTGKPWADNPALFDSPLHCIEPACLVWTGQTIGNLNEWADRGNFKACCNGINRGNPQSKLEPIGWADRQAWHKKALGVWETEGDAPVIVDTPVPVPLPVPPAKDVLPQTSRKWNLLNWLRGIFGLGATGTAGFSIVGSVQEAQSVMGPIKSFITEWGVPMLIVVCVVGFVMSQIAQYFMAQDYEDGRYQPSKEG